MTIFRIFFYHLQTFFNITFFSKYSFQGIMSVPNSLDPDQARRYVEPDLD